MAVARSSARYCTAMSLHIETKARDADLVVLQIVDGARVNSPRHNHRVCQPLCPTRLALIFCSKDNPDQCQLKCPLFCKGVYQQTPSCELKLQGIACTLFIVKLIWAVESLSDIAASYYFRAM